MRDLLSGLDHFDVHGGYLVSAGSRGEYVRVDDVREALTNPADEQVDAIYDATETLWETDGFGPHDMIRAVLAAAAGGDDA